MEWIPFGVDCMSACVDFSLECMSMPINFETKRLSTHGLWYRAQGLWYRAQGPDSGVHAAYRHGSQPGACESHDGSQSQQPRVDGSPPLAWAWLPASRAWAWSWVATVVLNLTVTSRQSIGTLKEVSEVPLVELESILLGWPGRPAKYL